MAEGFNHQLMFEYLSAFQKCIRRGMEEEAYYFGSKLEDINPKMLWNRIKIITSEDIGPINPLLPQTINTLYNWYWDLIGAGNSGGRLHLVNAILILCRSQKCRDTDNLLISMDIQMKEHIAEIPVPDFAYDKHTLTGKKMGRSWGHFFTDGVECKDDHSKPEWKNEARELIEKHGSAVDWKMAKLSRFKKDKNNNTLDEY